MSLALLKENLEKLGYTAHLFDSRREAADYLDAAIDGKRIGMGGSITLKELQLAPRLAAHNELIWHWEPREGRTVPRDQTGDSTRGMGIGLSVCGSIIKAHNGIFEANNRPDGGAVFRVSLPMNQETEVNNHE